MSHQQSPNFLATVGGVVDHVNIVLDYSLVTAQNLVTICHTVRVHVEGPKKFSAHWYYGTL